MRKIVLLVEDDPFLMDIYNTKLEKEGFEVKIAENGEKALKILGKEKLDLLILDIVLPKIDGWEILEKIKKDRELKNLPVIVLSNLGQKAEVEKGLRSGAVKYLIKAHFTPAEVVNEIKKILK